MTTATETNKFYRFTFKLSEWFERIAIIGFLGMVASTLVDVIGSKVFNKPLPVGTEAVYLFQLIAIGGALAISKIDGRHVRIELIDRIPQPARGIVHTLVALLGLLLFILLIWGSYDLAQSLRTNHEVTATSKIPIFPFAIWFGLSCIPMILVLLHDLFTSVMELIKK